MDCTVNTVAGSPWARSAAGAADPSCPVNQLETAPQFPTMSQEEVEGLPHDIYNESQSVGLRGLVGPRSASSRPVNSLLRVDIDVSPAEMRFIHAFACRL